MSPSTGRAARPGPIARIARWLVLPVAALLFLQWPLRDLVQAWSREANDIGQWLFALYIAVAVPAASRARAHIAAGSPRAFGQRTRRWLAATVAVTALVPWIGWGLWSGTPAIIASVGQAERFPDTLNPGYFVIKVALLLLLVLMACGALGDIRAALSGDGGRQAAGGGE